MDLSMPTYKEIYNIIIQTFWGKLSWGGGGGGGGGVQLILAVYNTPCCMYGKFMLWKMWCFTLPSMGRTNLNNTTRRPLNLPTLFTVRATPFHSEIGLSHSEICA